MVSAKNVVLWPYDREDRAMISCIDNFQEITRNKLIMIAGNYGSGKTEVSVNMAIAAAGNGLKVSIADMDIVNPYFRCREVQTLMKSHGIRVIIPSGEMASADTPIILPETMGMFNPPDGALNIFDVGGDPVGARILAGFRNHLVDSHYELWQVINSRRPFTDTIEGCLKMRSDIESASRLKVTGIIANSHLVLETTPDVIIEGYRLALAVSSASGIPVVFVTVMKSLFDESLLSEIKAPVFKMTRRMLPPWIRSCNDDVDDVMPAKRSVPWGRRIGATDA